MIVFWSVDTITSTTTWQNALVCGLLKGDNLTSDLRWMGDHEIVHLSRACENRFWRGGLVDCDYVYLECAVG